MYFDHGVNSRVRQIRKADPKHQLSAISRQMHNMTGPPSCPVATASPLYLMRVPNHRHGFLKDQHLEAKPITNSETFIHRLHKFNLEAKNDNFQKESPFPAADFQVEKLLPA